MKAITFSTDSTDTSGVAMCMIDDVSWSCEIRQIGMCHVKTTFRYNGLDTDSIPEAGLTLLTEAVHAFRKRHLRRRASGTPMDLNPKTNKEG